MNSVSTTARLGRKMNGADARAFHSDLALRPHRCWFVFAVGPLLRGSMKIVPRPKVDDFRSRPQIISELEGGILAELASWARRSQVEKGRRVGTVCTARSSSPRWMTARSISAFENPPPAGWMAEAWRAIRTLTCPIALIATQHPWIIVASGAHVAEARQFDFVSPL